MRPDGAEDEYPDSDLRKSFTDAHRLQQVDRWDRAGRMLSERKRAELLAHLELDLLWDEFPEHEQERVLSRIQDDRAWPGLFDRMREERQERERRSAKERAAARAESEKQAEERRAAFDKQKAEMEKRDQERREQAKRAAEEEDAERERKREEERKRLQERREELASPPQAA